MKLSLSCLVVLFGTACSRTPSEPPSGSTAGSTPSATPLSSAASVSSAASSNASSTNTAKPNLALVWDDPASWQKRKPSTSMRSAEYLVPHAGSDTEDAECFVITFGPGQGGGVDENIDRWVAQFASPPSPPARTKKTIHGMAMTRVEVGGTYTPMRMPGTPSAPASKGGERLIGAIVEAPSGSWFFKMTGPDATVKAASKAFDAMIDSVRSS